MTEFNWGSTTDEVLAGHDLTGKRALVTGVSAGLGVETARALAAHGAEVVGAARDLSKAREATRDIVPQIELVELDLSSLQNVRACADALLAEGRPLDLIIANAGIMATPEGKTVDGFELQMGTNHLGHFVLINRLARLLRPGARVVSLSSSAHQFSDVDFSDISYDKRAYDPFQAYGASKTANALFAVEFDRRHQSRGVRAVAVHPGMIATELVRHMTPETMEKMSALAMARDKAEVPQLNLKSVPQGAATSLWAAVTASGDAVGGRYCEDCGVADLSISDATGVRPYALDPDNARKLWEVSEQLVGEAWQ